MRKMRKTQIKLIEKAKKNGFTEEQIRVLSYENYTIDYLTELYEMMETGTDVAAIEAAMSLSGYRLDLLKKGYTAEDFNVIKVFEDKPLYYKFPYFYMFKRVLSGKSKHETDSSLYLEYAGCILDGMDDDVLKNKPDTIPDTITDIMLFAIKNKLPFHELLTIPHLSDMTFEEFACNRIPGYITFYEKYPDERKVASALSEDAVTAYQNVMKLHGERRITVDWEASYWMRYSLSPQAVNISLIRSENTVIEKDVGICCGGPSRKIEIVVFLGADGNIFIKKGNGRLFPLSFREISHIYQDYGEIGHDICEFLFTYTEKQFDASVMKDLYRTLCRDTYLNIPLKFSDCYSVKNCNQLMHTHYKTDTPINWNKADINVAYAIMKCLPYIRDVDKGRLLQETRNEELVPAAAEFFERNKQSYKASNFLLDYLGYNLSGNDGCYCYNNLSYFQDYFYLCREMHCKVSIGFKSSKKVIEAHDDMAERHRNRLHRVSVPKDSVFYPLRKLLPSDFEWIKSGKRLREEGIQMKHCVNMYYRDINDDRCAIYSLVRDGKRYTMEVIKKGNKYRIRQIFGYHNSDCPDEVRKYVKGFIK